MRTKRLAPILAVAIGLFTAGCGTMDVTTIGDANHPRDLGEPVLLRVTFRDAPPRIHYSAPRDPEVAALPPHAVILADSTP